MNGIQIILITGVVLIAVYFAFRVRNALIDLLTLTVCCGLAIFFIIAPDNTSVIANRLGVGRGADLLFYICILLFLFLILKLFARIQRLEAKITELIRDDAQAKASHAKGG